MATTQPAPGILQVSLVYEDDGEPMQNTFYVDNHAGTHWTEGNIDTIRTAFETWWINEMKPLLPVAQTLKEIICTDLTDLQGIRKATVMNASYVGANGAAQAASNVTKAFELFTGNRGRGVNGKTYWPGIAEDQITGSHLTTAFLTAAEVALGVLMAAIPAALPSAKLCVLSRVLNKAKRAAAVGRDIQSFQAPNDYADSQKRRLPAHRPKRKRVTP